MAVFKSVMVLASDLGIKNSVEYSSLPDNSFFLADAQLRYEKRPLPVTTLLISSPVIQFKKYQARIDSVKSL